MIRYQFADDEPLKLKAAKDANAQVLGEALEAITAAHGGRLKPADVVAAARYPSSPLNPHFEWDDSVAAEQFRLDQARSVIRVVRIVPADNHEPRRAFISVGDAAGRAYRPVGDVMSSTDLQARLMAQADKELVAFQARYRGLKELCGAIENLRDRMLKPNLGEKDRPAA